MAFDWTEFVELIFRDRYSPKKEEYWEKKEMAADGKTADGLYTLEEVSAHNTNKDCWLVIHGNVCDITSFLEDHPGGDEILLQVCWLLLFSPVYSNSHPFLLLLFLLLLLLL